MHNHTQTQYLICWRCEVQGESKKKTAVMNSTVSVHSFSIFWSAIQHYSSRRCMWCAAKWKNFLVNFYFVFVAIAVDLNGNHRFCSYWIYDFCTDYWCFNHTTYNHHIPIFRDDYKLKNALFFEGVINLRIEFTYNFSKSDTLRNTLVIHL